MSKFIFNFLIYVTLLFFLSGCSTITDKVDLAGIVDKTEEFFFGNNEDNQSEDIENTNDEEYQDLSNQDIPVITDIPVQRPDFSDIEEDFFEGEETTTEKEKEILEVSSDEISTNKPSEISVADQNQLRILRISDNVRIRVRSLLNNSDPPTKNDLKTAASKAEDLNPSEYNADDKIAVFYFPNNSVLPDNKATSVISQIVNLYNNNQLLVVGHASSLGGDTPKGKKINMNLSFARAEAIKNMLESKGFSPSNIKILGKGDLEPVNASNSDFAENENRRVEVFLLSN